MRATSRNISSAAACALLVACSTPPEENACASIVTVDADAGVAGERDPSGAWVVGGFDSGRLHFTGLTTFAIPHGLGRPPTQVVCQLSFSPDGPLAEQSGSVCLWLTRCGSIQGRTSDQVLLRNSTAQEYWARIIVR